MVAIPSTLEVVTYGGSDGSIQKGAHQQIIDGVGATRTLLAKESGALVLRDRTTGNVITLPAPVAGMQFEFATTVSVVASDTYKIVTNSASVFLLGAIFGYTTDATEIDGFTADGSTIVAVTCNGSTTGGVIGDYLRFKAISSTQWLVSGHIFCGTATPATPFATS